MKTNDAIEARKSIIADSLRSARIIDASTHDATEAIAFLTSQLAYVESKIYEKGRQPMQYEQLVPISTEAGEYAQSVEYEIYDYSGRGKKTSGKGKDINRVDVAYGRKSFPIHYGNIGYDYTQEELRVSAFLRRPLSERRAAVAMEAYKRHMNTVALSGETESGLTGLYNNASVPTANVPNGAGASPLWANKTPAEILKDVNAAILAVWNATQYNTLPTTIVLPPTQFNLIATTALSSTYPNKTILEWLREKNLATVQYGRQIEFVPGYGLTGAGAGATDRMVVYTKDPEKLVMHTPLPLRFLAPQLIGLAVEVPGEYKYSGVEIRYPKSAYYADGI